MVRVLLPAFNKRTFCEQLGKNNALFLMKCCALGAPTNSSADIVALTALHRLYLGRNLRAYALDFATRCVKHFPSPDTT
ncbi:hypothetical protein F4V45_06875 [Helicobacter canis]|uniref:Uncharacterized protein n=1 Tax=Helicobacter canis TaxID=29419 RepID=A0A5M9QJV1_9HELI|nr:hypothetical protein [Helicobacter canis]KAA8708157.1 hypothetical protein F4V45_06875 [Helicobacter canis]